MERILAVKLYAIGDLIMSLPGMLFLRRKNPSSEIHLLTSSLLAPLAGLSAPADRVIAMEDGALKGGRKGLSLLPLALRLRRNGYSRGYLMHRILPLRLFMRLACAGERIGQGTRTAGLSRVEPFESGQPEHDSQRYARLFGWTGEEELETPLLDLESIPRPAGMPAFSGTAPVALAPGGGRSSIRNTNRKRWPQDRFSRLLELLDGEGIPSVVLGSTEDGAFLGELRSRLPERSLDLVGATTLLDAAWVLSRCRLLITNDSSLMHIAGLAGTPTLTVFGPTDPKRIGVYPPSAKHVHVLPEGVECSPCHPARGIDECPEARCMLSITVDTVWERAGKMLSGLR